MENNIKENTKSYPFVIEYNTNYSVVLKSIRRTLSFEVIRKISNDLSYIYLSDSIKQDLHNTIMHGECMLSNLLELNAYMYDMGKMHNAKLRYACEHISENFKATKHIDIIDYGCGLGIGIISYADFLREKHLQQNVRRIVLIEPSYVALCRAALHARLLFPNAQIITINKKFDELEIGDLYRDSNISVLHIFSNILDIGNYDGSNSYFGYDLKRLATIVRESLKGNNEFLCIAPYYEYNFKDNKIPFFIENLGVNLHYKFIRGKGEFVNGKNWTCAIYVGSINNGIDDDTELIKIRSVEDEENVTQSISGNEELSHNVFETLTLNQFKERFKTDKIQIVRQSNNDLAFSCNGHKGCLTSNIKENIINNQPIGEVYFSFIEENDFLGWILHEKNESEYNSVDEVDEIIYSGVREIKAKEFLGNSSLKRVVIPNGVTKIGEYAFQRCTLLEKLEIPDSVTVIEKYAFSQCPKLKHVVLSKNLSKIEEALFWQCTSLESIEIPYGVTEIGFGAFHECSSLRQVILPKSVSKICNQAFAKCTSLESIEIPNSVTKIGEYAFQECTSLESIEIPDSVTAIEKYAFSKCSKLKHVVLSKNLSKIEEALFWQCTSLESIEIPYGVTEIGAAAFLECSSLRQVVIPNTVAKLSKLAFTKCTSLESIEIPYGVTEIEKRAFLKCSNLRSVVIPNSVTKIGEYAFQGCMSLENLEIPDSVTVIEKYAFSQCPKLKHVVLSNSISKIEEDLFWQCSSLEGVLIPNSVQKIGPAAFKECTSIESIDIPYSVTEIEKQAFLGCSSLVRVVIPDAITKIGEYAFQECTSLESIEFLKKYKVLYHLYVNFKVF